MTSKLTAFLIVLLALQQHAQAEESIAPFLKAHCSNCHNAEKKKGKLDLSPLVENPDLATADALSGIFEALESMEMPPDDEPQPSLEERAAFLEKLRPRLAEAEAELMEKASQPGHGNLVDHELLFSEPEVRRAATPARAWRLSPHLFMNRANSLSRTPLLRAKRNQGGDGLHPAFAYMTPPHAFRDHAKSHAFEEATTELLVDVCWQIAGIQAHSTRMAAPIKVMQNKKDPTRADWRRLVKMQFAFALKKEPTIEESLELTRLGERTFKKTKATREAMQTVLAAILLRPGAVYRFEFGQGPPGDHGRVALAPYERMMAIAYALTDRIPDEELHTAVADGKFQSPEEIRAQIDRLLDHPESQARILRFFREYFEYPRARSVFKDARPPNAIFADNRISDADALVNFILKEDRDVLKRLLIEDRLFVTEIHPVDSLGSRQRRFYHPDYGFPPDWEGLPSKDEPVAPHVGRRSGILTHPAWLLAFSDNEKNQAIQRGRWIRTKLLGGMIPDTPIGVDASFPSDPHLTLREKMEVTREAYCWKCHEKMDPLGLPFEQFDEFGRFRTAELDKPVVTSGRIETGLKEIDGEVADPFEMMERLANSEHVEQVFVRHVFRYFLGRNETPDDAPTLMDAHRAYQKNGGSMKALVAELLTSDSFLLRKVETE